MKEIYRIVVFFIFKGFMMPNFEDFTYYFLMDEIKISKLTFAFLILVA